MKLAPASAFALYGCGIAFAKQGQAAASQADLAAARKLQPSVDTEAARFGLAAPSRAARTDGKS